jgi:hypothetical protein
MFRRRASASAFSIDAPACNDRIFRVPLSDEVAIDFPSAQAALDCLRRDRVDAEGLHRVTARIALSTAQASAGAIVTLGLILPHMCECCGGRGERWGEGCDTCRGSGHALRAESLELQVPAGTTDGDGISFYVTPARGPRTRIDVHVAVGA